MEDFNRISFVAKNSDALKGIMFVSLALIYFGQNLAASQMLPIYTNFGIFYLVPFLVVPLILVGFSYLYYKKSIGRVTVYPTKLGRNAILLNCLIPVIVIIAIYEGIQGGTGIFTGLLFAFLILLLNKTKEDWSYRKYNLILAAICIVISILPLNQYFPVKDGFYLLNLKVSLYAILLFGIRGVLDHFLLLRLMRPLRAESIKNSQASQDPILGEPANLTILAVLSNCRNADFTFLRKMSQLEETEFYRRIYGLEQVGLIWTHELPNGVLNKVRRASITPTGWQIVNQIYNESLLDRRLPGTLVHA